MKNLVVLDCEVYINYFLIAFKNLDDNKVVAIEAKGEQNCLSEDNRKRLYNIMVKRETFGFNCVNYDIPIILGAMRQKTCKQIKEMSDTIIKDNLRGWQTLQQYGLAIPEYIKNFDIQEVAPGIRTSLKLYGARMHSKRLQDLPYEPDSILTDEQIEVVKKYCINDLDTTIDLYNQTENRVQLRKDMAVKYGKQVMSKSDAQIAEVVIKKELQSKTKSLKVSAPKIKSDATFTYNIPSYITFESPILNDVLDIIENSRFEIDKKGSIKLPPELKKLKIRLGYSTYQLGVGGIHSSEKKQSIVPGDNEYLIDKDVEAYYPRIILNLKLFPKHLGESFLHVYKDIVNQRIKAKKEKNKVINESLKIVINGSFGKLGNKYSCLYSPDLMIAVTLTGQLSLLMLIEQLENNGIKVISANTDGFVSIVPKHKHTIYQSICFNWELLTGFDLEENRYKALYSRDVNNYLAIKLDNDTKGKGLFTLNEISKNPSGDIATIAVINYLRDNTPITKTITECKDITKFLFVRSVTGGAIWKGNYLGKVVRWIYSTKGDVITYKKANKKGTHPKVPKSDGCRPIMELGEFPNDIDYNRYIQESLDILDDLNLNNL